MMKKKYKIGNFTLEINSQVDFPDTEPFSLFLYNGDDTDYSVNVNFSSLPETIENPQYTSRDRVCVYENGVLRCYYISRDSGGGYYACRVVDGKNISITVDEKYRDMLWERVVFSLLGIEERVSENNGCILHSSFIEKEGEAVLFTGPCSIGKSTQANLWRDYAHAIVVNGDKSLIFEKDGVFYASGLPFSGSSKDCLNKTLSIKAIICLGQDEKNLAQRIEKNTFNSIYKNCYPVPYSREHTGAIIDLVQKLSQSVPVYEYFCRADESAVRYLERELW